jgi:hypothetical protein
MTLRKRMHVALPEITLAAHHAESNWRRYERIDNEGDIRIAHERHMEGLREAYRLIAQFGEAPEAVEKMLALHAKSPKAFDAIMVWVGIELARADAPAEQAEAA